MEILGISSTPYRKKLWSNAKLWTMSNYFNYYFHYRFNLILLVFLAAEILINEGEYERKRLRIRNFKIEKDKKKMNLWKLNWEFWVDKDWVMKMSRGKIRIMEQIGNKKQ